MFDPIAPGESVVDLTFGPAIRRKVDNSLHYRTLQNPITSKLKLSIGRGKTKKIFALTYRKVWLEEIKLNELNPKLVLT